MYWPLLIDAASSLASGLWAHLPWVLFASGLLIQAAGVVVLAHRHRQSVRADEVIVFPAQPSNSDHVIPVAVQVRFVPPIMDGQVPRDPALLPGARRAYRGGEHEGVDFSCRPGTQVLAAADGWVLSIDDEPSLPETRRNEVLDYSRSLGRTPPEVLQALYGRRVVVCHGLCGGKLLTTSYAHLDHVRQDLSPGDRVKQGEEIGVAGASGTSHDYHPGSWAELHFEIRLNGEPLGIGLKPTEAGALYRSLLSGGRRE